MIATDPPRQLVLDLPPMAGDGLEDFLTAPSNRAALDAVLAWPDWPARAMVLYGPAGSGKTHLAGIWAARSGGLRLQPAALWPAAEPLRRVAGRRTVVVDDADRVTDEEELFHVHNAVLGAAGWLLLTGADAVSRWPVSLPDLRSRLRAAATVAIQAPDDTLIASLLVKQLTDRQLRVEPPVIDYLVPRLERSFAAVRAVVTVIDRASLRARRPVTVQLARLALDELALEADDA